MEIDWSGSTAFIIDRDTGEKVKAYVFVATLPCSQLSYAETTLSMDLHSWITKLGSDTLTLLGYAKGILKTWHKKGIQTVADTKVDATRYRNPKAIHKKPHFTGSNTRLVHQTSTTNQTNHIN